MAVSQIFNVATQFKFEVGSALIGASNLQQSVDKLSQSAENTLVSFQRLGIGIVGSFGIGGGGVIGILQKAIQVSEKFKDSQLKFSTIFAANKDRFTGPVDDFNARLQVSSDVLKNIAKQAKIFSLDEGALADQSSLLAAQLSSKGLAGTNLEVPITIARDFLKAAPVLGVTPEQSQGQLLNLIEGAAGGQNTLFRRLTGETQAFGEFVGNAKKFNQLKAAERVAKITEGLREFTSQTDEVEARTKLLSNRMNVLRNVLVGFDGIIKPIGDFFGPLFADLVGQFTKVADTEFRATIENVVKSLKVLIPNLESAAINLYQLSKASEDVGKTVKTLGILGIITFLKHFRLLGYLFSIMGVVLSLPIAGLVFLNAKLGLIGLAFKAIGFVVSKVMLPFLGLLAVFQLLSRARGYAKANDLMQAPKMIARTAALGARFMEILNNSILKPIIDMFDSIAKFISPIFSASFYMNIFLSIMEALASMLEFVNDRLLLAQATLRGIFFAIFSFVESLINLNFAGLGQRMADAYSGGMNESFEMNQQRFSFGQVNKDKASNQITNINGGVKIINEFKENLEPDRIAFSIQSQLEKIAGAPRQARGASVGRGLTTRYGGAN